MLRANGAIGIGRQRGGISKKGTAGKVLTDGYISSGQCGEDRKCLNNSKPPHQKSCADHRISKPNIPLNPECRPKSRIPDASAWGELPTSRSVRLREPEELLGAILREGEGKLIAVR